MNRVLVFGGRDFDNYEKMKAVLDSENEKDEITSILHGACDGADLLAERWAKEREVPYIGIPAQWTKYGRAAGPRRNKQMANLRPTYAIAFPGGNGTADMKRKAIAAGIPIKEID